ncbi:MAG TPA: flagellar biosynthesis protein FlhF [Kofleriaceae bacterium]|nr:flagellar biosynthesis protein FlhF [Kofleriaceae bacterium]
MKILKFEGASMREALSKVKAELGDQAVVVSTRQVRKGLLGTGYEISAAIDDDEPAALPPASLPPHPPKPAPRAALADDEVERVVGPLRAELRSLRALVKGRGDDRPGAELRNELVALRRAVEDLQRPGAPAASPGTGAGAGAASTKATLPPRGAPAPTSTATATQAASLPPRTTQASHAAPSSPAGALTAPSRAQNVLLVGPTGVGKTTTIAKIAARAALIDGKKVALVTLDNYRVGGVDQIRTFADLIGVPLHVVEDPAQLADQLAELAGYDLVLIDTAGRSPRDRAGLDSLRVVASLPQLEVHLTVPAGSSAAQVDELARRFAALHPRRLLFTKIDECDQAPELIAAPTRLKLPVTWLGTGQAVPEDLEVATSSRLLELASRGLGGQAAA